MVRVKKESRQTPENLNGFRSRNPRIFGSDKYKT
jgi:hypothetical protein